MTGTTTLITGRGRSLVGRLQDALGCLRHVTDVDGLPDKVVQAACAGCDLDRAILFRVDGSLLIAEGVHMPSDPQCGQGLLRAARENPVVLEHEQVETEMVRRRISKLVRAAGDDGGSGLVRLTRCRSFVAAPIMPEGRVIGILYGDRAVRDGDVSELDRDLLGTFAEGVGHVIQSALLRERMEDQRAQLQRMMYAATDAMRTACEAEITLGTVASDKVVALRPSPERADRLQSLLTPRELEVLELVAEGETNGGIAHRLVISEGTVKSHVKSLLRKLHVANRAEAVSRYHRIAAVVLDGA